MKILLQTPWLTVGIASPDGEQIKLKIAARIAAAKI
jgi:hypothetical protein